MKEVVQWMYMLPYKGRQPVGSPEKRRTGRDVRINLKDNDLLHTGRV